MTATSLSKIASLVTVTSRDYLPGTQVMLHSFLQKHRGFNGEIVILSDDLTDDDQQQLASTFDRINFERPSDDLVGAIGDLVEGVPKLRGRARRFYSLEAFHPDREGDVLFCDGDLLFRSSIDEMLAIEGSLIACGDRAQVMGSGRDPHSLAELEGLAEEPIQQSGFATFNAGLMIIRQGLRTKENWTALLAQLDQDSWHDIASEHTDQAVYNRLFGDQVSLADGTHNHLVGHGRALRENAGVSMSDAKVLHFNGPAKPWNFPSHLAAAQADAAYIRAAQDWYSAYTKFLAAYHFASSNG